MTYMDHLKLIKRLHLFIKRKATGCPESLARKLGVSEPTVYRYIRDLRNMGAPIFFDRDRQSYVYEEVYELEF